MSHAAAQQVAWANSVTKEEPYLPKPPDDKERDLYLGPQRRWVVSLSFFGYILIVISVILFVRNRPWTMWLLGPLAICTASTLLSVITSSRRHAISFESHRKLVESWVPDYVPSVDVFLPTAGEELEILCNTYYHVSNLKWAGVLKVYVLDDSARPTVRELAERHGFVYLSRPNRGHLKKAGNLRYGFERSQGDLIAILDADFVPRSDFLFELAPYMEDESIGIVQSPQYFDIDKSMNWLQRTAGATQILFYRWVQPSRNRSNAAICVGTCALYRRSALHEAGGFPEIDHSEDVYTSISLTKIGYRLEYVPTVVSKGICPNTFSQFISQQYRWCFGSMSLLLSSEFHRMRLSAMGRLSYWSGFLYYITTAINVFAIPLPTLLLGCFAPSEVQNSNYVFVLLALVVHQAIVPFLTCERESLVGLARIQTTYSLAHVVALFDALRRRSDSWIATGAVDRTPTARRVLRLARIWLGSVQLLLWGSIAWGSTRYGIDRYWLTIAFALLDLYVIHPILLGITELPRLPRARSVSVLSRERGRHEARVPVTIHHITVGRSELTWVRPSRHAASALRGQERHVSRDAAL